MVLCRYRRVRFYAILDDNMDVVQENGTYNFKKSIMFMSTLLAYECTHMWN